MEVHAGFPSVACQGAREHGGERAALRHRGDRALVELELEAQVSLRRELPAERGGESVCVAAVGRVAANAKARELRPEPSLPGHRQGALATPLGVVEDPDLEVALRTAPDGSEAVHGEVQDASASRGDRRPDAVPVGAVVAGEERIAPITRQAAAELGEDGGVVG